MDYGYAFAHDIFSFTAYHAAPGATASSPSCEVIILRLLLKRPPNVF